MGHEFLWADWERDERVRIARRERQQDRLARLASDAKGVQPESTGLQRGFQGPRLGGLVSLLKAAAYRVLGSLMAREPNVERKGS